MITTTDAQVMATLKQVVSERPEYTYSAPEYMVVGEDAPASCFYVHVGKDGQSVSAGCGVGEVFHRLGVPLEEMRRYEGQTSLQMIKHVISGVTRETANKLRIFQAEQDSQRTWGESYVRATGETI
ncbi:hypothetical protein [Streptomyces sp. NPDC002324]